MIRPDPVQKLRDPRPEYLVIRRIETDGHFENHVIFHIFIVSAFPEMSMEEAIKRYSLDILFVRIAKKLCQISEERQWKLGINCAIMQILK